MEEANSLLPPQKIAIGCIVIISTGHFKDPQAEFP